MFSCLKKIEYVKIAYYALFVFSCILILKFVFSELVNKIIYGEEPDYFKYLTETYPYWFDSANYITKGFEKKNVIYVDPISGKYYAHYCTLFKENIVDHSLVYQYNICDRQLDTCYIFYRLSSPNNDINLFYVSTQFGDEAFSICIEYIQRLEDAGGDPTLIAVDEFPEFIINSPSK
jgi:hypothetical protein